MASLGLGLGLPFRRAAAAAPAHPLLTLNPRFLYAGGGSALSTFAQNSDGTSPNTTAGQYTKYVQDLSGNGLNALEDSAHGSGWPVFAPNETILGAETGGNNTIMPLVVPLVPMTNYTNECDIFLVQKATPGVYGVCQLLSFGGVYPQFFHIRHSSTALELVQSGYGIASSACSLASNKIGILRMQAKSNGSYSVVSVYRYAIDGTLLATATHYSNIAGLTSVRIGGRENSVSSGDSVTNHFGIIFKDRIVEGADEALVFSHISSAYWSLT